MANVANRELLEEAAKIVDNDRNEAYDHPFDNFTRIAKVWSGILDLEITPEQVGLCMVGVKLAREAFKPKQDNIVDGIGYLLCLNTINEINADFMENDYGKKA